MSESVQIVDARGLPCPQPVVLVRKALEALASGGKDGGEITVLVDNDTARDNVVRYASYVGREATVRNDADGVTRIIIASLNPEAGASQAGPAAPAPPPGSAIAGDPLTIFLASDRIGQGDDELGALLMKGFLYAVAESDVKPVRMIFMNSGVKLTVEGSAQLENLRRLQGAGVDLLSCGTCLDFYGLKEKLAVGRVSNMYEIVGFLSSGRVLRP